MASAKPTNNQQPNKSAPTIEKVQDEVHLIEFLNTRQGYLPGEQVLLTYSPKVKGSYTMDPGDHIALHKCGNKSSSQLNSYKWPVSCKLYGKVCKVKLSLPNPDRRLKTNEYQFIYISQKYDKVIGRSSAFKISDIVELESEIFSGCEPTLDVANVVDREMFEVKVTNPRPVKLFDVNRSISGRNTIQTDCHMDLSNELRNALNAQVSSDSIIRVAELIRQYEQTYGTAAAAKASKTVNQTDKKPMSAAKLAKTATNAQKIQKSSNRSQTVNTSVIDIEDTDVAFMERFVFPYISGVLQYLANEGFSKIICKNSQVAVLRSDSNEVKTLDLRRPWDVVRTTDTKHSTSQTEISELTEKVKLLSAEVTSLRNCGNSRHIQYMKEIEKMKKHISNQCGSCDYDEDDDSMDKLRETNRTLIARVGVLQKRLDDKTEECEMLSKLFVSQACCLQHNDSVELLRKHVPNWRRVKQSRNKRASTNTNQVVTKDEAAGTACATENRETATCAPASRPPVVQKATSYAAATSHHTSMATKEDKKPTATSDRGLTKSLTNDQQSFLKLLRKLLRSEHPDGQLEEVPAKDTDSTESLAMAMRQLFNMQSTPSLASTNTSRYSIRDDESVTEAIRTLFADSTSSSHLPKTNSYPATPCNSADTINKNKTEDLKHSTSMREVLEKLLNVREDRNSAAASNGSMWSLGDAMIKAFTEDANKKEKDSGLSTSNDSLAHAMNWLFDTLSQHNLANSSNSDISHPAGSDASLGSVLLWGLADGTPEEYENVDVKAINREKACQKKLGINFNCECLTKKEMKNPSLSSVIRTASPDRDVNISFPANKQPAHPLLFQAKEPVGKEPELANLTSETSGVATLVSGESRRSREPLTLNDHIHHAVDNRTTRTGRVVRRKVKKVCPNCSIVIQAQLASQAAFRMRRHIRTHHKRDDLD